MLATSVADVEVRWNFVRGIWDIWNVKMCMRFQLMSELIFK